MRSDGWVEGYGLRAYCDALVRYGFPVSLPCFTALNLLARVCVCVTFRLGLGRHVLLRVISLLLLTVLPPAKALEER